MTDLSAFSRQRTRCRIVMWHMVRGCGGNVPKCPKFWDVGASRNATQVLRRHAMQSLRPRANRSLPHTAAACPVGAIPSGGHSHGYVTASASPGVRASEVVAEVLDLFVLAHAHSATSAAKHTVRIWRPPEAETTIPRNVMWVFTHGEERILRVLAAPHRALQSSFLDHRECAFRKGPTGGKLR